VQSPESDHTAESRQIEAEREADLNQLKERLAFYESFDRLIQDNISRAGELLREAAAKRSETELALRNSTAELDRQRTEEKVGYRRLFSGLLDQIQTVQQNVERLAREVSDALDDLESTIPATGELGGDELPPLPTYSGSAVGSLGAGSGSSDTVRAQRATLEPVDELTGSDETEQEEGGGSLTGVGSPSSFSEGVQASVERISQSYAAPEPEPDSGDEEAPVTFADAVNADHGHDDDGDDDVDQPAEYMEGSAADDDFDVSPEEPFLSQSDGDASASDVGIRPGADDQAPEAAFADATGEEPGEAWIDPLETSTTTVLVHGVPRATTALSLKRYLEGLAQVNSVEPREYAEGVLRLQVSAAAPIGLDEIRGWPEAQGMEAVTVQPDFVEVKLPQ
jgi:hypothetical protein